MEFDTEFLGYHIYRYGLRSSSRGIRTICTFAYDRKSQNLAQKKENQCLSEISVLDDDRL